MDEVNAIGFDLDHTIAIDNRLERVAFLRLLEAILEEGGRTLGTLGDEIDSVDDLLAQQRRGDFSIDDAVRRFVAARSVEPTQQHVEFFRRRAVEMVDEFVVPLPGVARTLEALRRRGIATAILSNGWNPLQGRKARYAGFCDLVLVSSELGTQKPSPRAFQLLLEALGTDARQTWYVGDDPRHDVAGAQAVGMQGVWINWERKEYPVDVQAPRHSIGSLDELVALLPAPARVS